MATDYFGETEKTDNMGNTPESDDSDTEFLQNNELDENGEGSENFMSFNSQEDTQHVFEWKCGVFTPQVYNFDPGNSGSRLDDSKYMREIDYFKIFVHENLVNLVATETNRQYHYLTKNLTSRPERLKSWVDTNADEIYVFLALFMLMSHNSRNLIADHWSKDHLLHSPIYSETMSRNRFQIILRMLHFCNNDDQIPGDRLFKIRTVVDEITKVFQEQMYPYQNVCIKESIILFKGRSMYNQYIPSKEDRFGIKFCMICDCATGYILNFIIYTGKTTEYTRFEHLDMSESILLSLMEPYLERGHTLFVDGSYTTPLLLQTLFELKTNACGIIKKNAKHMPKFQQKLEIGQTEAYHTDSMSAQRWKGAKEVTVLTTCHSNTMCVTKEASNSTHHAVMKPKSIIEYNKNVRAIEKCDVLFSSVHSIRKTMKWYKKLFFQLIDICMINAHAIYTEKTGKRVPLSKFELEVIRQIINHYKELHADKLPTPKRRKPDTPLRLFERHFIERIPSTLNRPATMKRCVVCLQRKRRKETRFCCKQCDVALCIEPCFEIYHTKLNYSS